MRGQARVTIAVEGPHLGRREKSRGPGASSSHGAPELDDWDHNGHEGDRFEFPWGPGTRALLGVNRDLKVEGGDAGPDTGSSRSHVRNGADPRKNVVYRKRADVGCVLWPIRFSQGSIRPPVSS